MISVFQIFKMLLGVIVFVFVITFFLRISDMYSGAGDKQLEFEIADAFDKAVKQTYMTGNPTTFTAFTEYELLMYNAPKMLFRTSQKTFTVPLFMVPAKTEMTLERRCEDYGWFMFCFVFAYSDTTKILFTPLENNGDTRSAIKSMVETLPEAFEFGYCNATEAKVSTRAAFLNYIVNDMPSKSFKKCEVEIEEDTRLVTFGSVSEIAENEIAITGSTVKGYVGDELESVSFSSHDVIPIVTGGVPALKYKKEKFKKELKASSGIMGERSKLIHSMMLEHNYMPCQECPTPYPIECGWLDDNTRETSDLYLQFISTLVNLDSAIDAGSYESLLERSSGEYEALREAGCEE